MVKKKRPKPRTAPKVDPPEEKAKFKPGDNVTVEMILAHGVHVHDAPGVIVSANPSAKQYWVETHGARVLLDEKQLTGAENG